MVPEQDLQEREVRLGQLDIREDISQRDLQTHLERDVKGILQGLVLVHIKHPEVHIVAGESAGEGVEHETDACGDGDC